MSRNLLILSLWRFLLTCGETSIHNTITFNIKHFAFYSTREIAAGEELRYNYQCVEAAWKQAAVKSVDAGGTKELEPRKRKDEEDEEPQTDHVVLGEPLTVNTELTVNQNTEEQIANKSLLEISNDFVDIDSNEISPS